MHKLIYSNSCSSWNEALPLGNGHFGAMLFYEGNEIICSMNHYDVYYKKLPVYGGLSGEEKKSPIAEEPASFEVLKKRALDAHDDKSDPGHYNYNYVRRPEMKEQYGSEWNGYSHYLTGNLKIGLDDGFAGSADFKLSLEVEAARVVFNASGENGRVASATYISHDRDIMVTEIEQTSVELLKSISMEVPCGRMQKILTQYMKLDKSTFYHIGSFYSDDVEMQVSGVIKQNLNDVQKEIKPFSYIVMTKLIGAEGTVIDGNGGLYIRLQNASHKLKILTVVVTELEQKCKHTGVYAVPGETGQCGLDANHILILAAEEVLSEAVNKLDEIRNSHQAYWNSFWKKSSISIDDKFLEDLWYINLYSIACCNGKGAKLFEQACGLNGLWDIKQPTIWGSSWYWDVNIEQNFWPVYTCNHPELGEPFYKGLQSYVTEGEARAGEYYGLEGIAPDRPYPFTFYMTIWPWCAQFFQWHYLYTQDKVFLSEQAYPLFKGILKFFEGFLQYDREKEKYYIFPDISPEQGPVTQNSTICLAFLRNLLRASIKASEILNKDFEEREIWKNILLKLPFYPMDFASGFGMVIKDSDWSHPDMHQIGHTSLIAPVYPVGEINKRSDCEIREIAANTIRYMEKLQPLSTHTSGWLACAAARMGLGDKAADILYEKVIAFQMRTNGLFAEETERWMQSCLTMCEPMYNPPLMEASGNFVAAVNEMLLQSYGEIIEVFPACPEGHMEEGVEEFSYSAVLNALKKKESRIWNNACFDRLLAEGGFEVSAERRDGITLWVKIKSLYGNNVTLINPFPADHVRVKCMGGCCVAQYDGDLSRFETEKDMEYMITANDDAPASTEYSSMSDRGCEMGTQIYRAPSGRRVYLGKDKDTDFIRNLDCATFDFYAGEQRESHMPRYRLDFSLPSCKLHKNYEEALPRQFHGNGKMGINFKRIPADMRYSDFTGLGWQDTDSLIYIDRAGPDPLRRDFIAGKCRNTFMVELPKGKYDLVFISGDSQESSNTRICLEENGVLISDINLPAGSFAAESFPVNHRRDGVLKIAIDTVDGSMWKLCGLIINELK